MADVTGAITEYLGELGYHDVADEGMRSKIAQWWGWYRADCAFYHSKKNVDNVTYKVDRITVHPARQICEDWAGLVLNEGTSISLGASDGETAYPEADKWLQDWLASSGFLDNAHRVVERAFALGTAAWSLCIKGLNDDGSPSPGARIVPQRWDARQMVPLSYDEDGCDECAFECITVVGGYKCTQVQVYRHERLIVDEGLPTQRIEAGPNYEMLTAWWDKDAKRVYPGGMAERIATGSPACPFALVRPALDNPYCEWSPWGRSILDTPEGAIQLVDEAVDNMHRDIFLGQKMVFMDEGMLGKDEDGNTVVPRAEDQQLFRKVGNDTIGGDRLPVTEYNPDLRVDQNTAAVETALALMGRGAGLGDGFYRLTESGVAKTATEVASSQDKLMRSFRKHCDSITPAIEGICEAAVSLASAVQGLSLPDVRGMVHVSYDDSVIEDTGTLMARDRADVAAGLMPRWMYVSKWRTHDDDKARELVDEMGTGAQASSAQLGM